MKMSILEENLQIFIYKNYLRPLYKISTTSKEDLHYLFSNLPYINGFTPTPVFYKKIEKLPYIYFQIDTKGFYYMSWSSENEFALYTIGTEDLKEFIEIHQLFGISLEKFVEQKGF